MYSTENQLTFNFDLFASKLKSNNPIVLKMLKKYKSINDILNANPEIIQMVHKDLQAMSKKKNRQEKRGRKCTFSVPTLFRALIVKKMENYTFDQVTLYLSQMEIFRAFCNLGTHESINQGFLCRVEKAISPQTWEKNNQILTGYVVSNGGVDVSEARMDATVVENEVHYPTDSSLLWDSYRTLSRYMSRILIFYSALTRMRFHKKKTKKYHLDITRYASSKSKKRKNLCKHLMKKLCRVVEQTCNKALPIVQQAQQNLKNTNESIPQKVRHSITWLAEKIPVMNTIVDVASRRIKGEDVPTTDKVFSLFENHAEMIIRGRAGIQFELGHKIFLSQSRSKFILDYDVLEKCKSDTELLKTMTERHEKRFGKGSLQTVHADKGCRSKEEEMKKLEERITHLYVPSRLRDLHEPELVTSQKFRAGIEGSISCLKRQFGLATTRKRSFKSFCNEIGLSIFCHNLRILITLLPKS